jgi:pSer/pThr/pTyr-binding forkhead associated (FHA) protein
MHGTYVNGCQLAPNVPKPLSSGDKVQLGADVNRNDSG